MRIALDGRPIDDHFPGIGRYVFNLARALAETEPRIELLLLHRSSGRANTRYDLDALRSYPRLRLVPVDAPNFSLREQWRLPAVLRQLQVDLYHSPYYLMPYGPSVPAVVTLYDLIPSRYPAGYSPGARLAFYLAVRLAVRRAARVITISRASAKDIQQQLGLPGARLAVIPLAADPEFAPRPAAAVTATRARLGLPDDYVLYVGSNKPHKNLPGLVQAYLELEAAPPLIVAGHWDERYQQARQLAGRAPERVRFIGPVAVPDLPALYTGALLFVFPSRCEGFGLPPLEAMACGVPVVCSQASSLPEVVGEAGLLFDPNDPDALLAALRQALSDRALRSELRRRGLARAARFSWQATARQTAAVYAQVLGAPA